MRKGVTLETLLRQHWDDRIIVFAKSVEEVYALSRRFLIPGVTYETPARERKEILDRFREGRYRAVIASDVLNEGVDVPDAGVAVILAGSASRRRAGGGVMARTSSHSREAVRWGPPLTLGSAEAEARAPTWREERQ